MRTFFQAQMPQRPELPRPRCDKFAPGRLNAPSAQSLDKGRNIAQAMARRATHVERTLRLPAEQPRNSRLPDSWWVMPKPSDQSSEDSVMSYDLIESTLIRLGEEMRERLSASYQTREADLPSDSRCYTKRRASASSVGRRSSLLSRPRQKPGRASHEKDRVC